MIALTLLDPTRLWLLIGLVPLVIVYFVGLRRRSRSVIAVPTTPLLGLLTRPRRAWRRHIGAAVLLLALATTVFASARPASAHRVPLRLGTVVVALDTSRSMQASDVRPSRLSAAQTAAVRFVISLPSRLRVGIVTFAEDAAIAVPPTHDRTRAALALRTVVTRDGTAIGEAIYKAIDAINVDRQTSPTPGGRRPAGIVLLSDGDSTAGRSPRAAARAARAAGINVATISFGTDDGAVILEREVVPAPVSTRTLRNVAAEADGEYFEATSVPDLQSVYSHVSRQLGTRVAHREITSRVLVGGAALILLALAAGAIWSPRLP
jgi:Ca-activated chloride channel family protein